MPTLSKPQADKYEISVLLEKLDLVKQRDHSKEGCICKVDFVLEMFCSESGYAVIITKIVNEFMKLENVCVRGALRMS